MDLTKIDLNLFVVLESIYAESSLSGAARRLYVTQPAVSAALARLRELFGDPLFVRTGRRMVPTPTTENIIPQVREALALMRGSVDEGYHFEAAREQKTFRLCMSDLSETILLPGLYEVLEKEAPLMSLQVMQLNRREALKTLSAGRLDFVVDAPLLSDDQLCHAPLLEGQYLALVRENHPVLEREFTLEAYLNLRHLHVSSRTSGPGYVDYALERINARRRIAVRTQHYLMVPQLIGQSDLCATVPGYLANLPGTVALELPFHLAPQGQHLYWHRTRDSDPAIQWLREVILRLQRLAT